ncbi:hypothetical protein DEJ28_07920 [Curtobacterium sp. MCPF17_002]|nr:hypothetical protein [Curtobacterium sp. MCPF17_002]WIB79014.1 hypothetical protein DEJ28_07920 [Curtobacterium sp. MCPF17_002]
MLHATLLSEGSEQGEHPFDIGRTSAHEEVERPLVCFGDRPAHRGRH